MRGLILPIMVAGWVLGSIYAGIASVSEAAGMGVVGTLLSAAIRKELTWKVVTESLHQTISALGKLIWITFGATALIGVYNVLGGIAFVKSMVVGLPLPPLAIVLVMMLILLILGFFMDWIGIMLLTMPVFVPIIIALGFSPVWFGVLFCMNMQVSYLTPPFGPAAFYLKGVAPENISLSDIYVSLIPFIFLQLLALTILVLFPEIALWLPRQVFG